jgi:hypothetical protein
VKNPAFVIKSVTVKVLNTLTVTFGDGKELDVNLSKIIDSHPTLSLLKDLTVFNQAHIDTFGTGVRWTEEIDLAGDNLRAEAIEQAGGISHEQIWNWMYRNHLTLDTAAEALGISRRMVAYYRNGEKTVPKHIWLACLGWENFVAQKKAA